MSSRPPTRGCRGKREPHLGPSSPGRRCTQECRANTLPFGVARAPTNQHRPEAEHGPIRKQAGCTREISTELPRCAEANITHAPRVLPFLPFHQARTEQVTHSPCWGFYPLHIFVTAPGYPEAQANAALLRTIQVRGPEPHRVPLASLVPELWSLCTSSCLSARPKPQLYFQGGCWWAKSPRDPASISQGSRPRRLLFCLIQGGLHKALAFPPRGCF